MRRRCPTPVLQSLIAAGSRRRRDSASIAVFWRVSDGAFNYSPRQPIPPLRTWRRREARLNTLHPPAVNRPSHGTDEAPTAEESLAAHARRAMRTRVRARITAVLDAGIATLQKLRNHAGGAPDASPDADRAESRYDRPRERPGAVPAPAEAEAPKPKRRLRAFLIYVCLILAGGLGGAALAYSQFQKQFDRQLEASRRLETALAKKTLPDARSLQTFEEELIRRDQAAQKLASAFAEFSTSADNTHSVLKRLLGQQFAENRRLQAVLAENARASAETRQALQMAQTARAEAEARLASSLVEHARSATETQRQLDTAEKQLAMLRDVASPRSGQHEPPATRRTNRPAKTGKCTLSSGNVDDLKGCIDDFNR